jgi:hypothetical protein
MKDGRSDKEFYRLWWEYLHRSEDYKEICQWVSDGADLRKLSPKYKKPNGRIRDSAVPLSEIGLSEEESDRWFLYNQSVSYKEGKKRWLLSPIIIFFQYSGDIRSASFDDWYQRMKKHAEQRKDARRPVLFLKEALADDFPWSKGFLRLRLGRVPSVEDVQAFTIDEVYAAPATLCLVIHPMGFDAKEIADEVEKIIRIHKKDYILSDVDKCFFWCVAPVGRKQIIEIQRYLAVYDIWKAHGKGRLWKASVKEKILHYKNKADLSRQCVYEINAEIDDDRKNAQQIICNAERGVFPGKY